MEEANAVEYYNDLLQKGGNAARFKQGLGFGTSAPSVLDKEEQGSLGNFVKGSNLEKDADVHKDIKIENIRNKLQKREDRSTRVSRHPDGDRKKSSGKPAGRSESEERGSRAKSERRRRSASLEKDKERTRRSRSPRRRNRRRSSRSSSDDNNSSQSSGRRRRRDRNGSGSRVDDRRGRHGRRSSPTIAARSSPEGRRWNGGHSRSRGRDRDYKDGYRRRRDYSPHSQREFSRSPSPDRKYRRSHTQNRSTGRADSPYTYRSDRRRENEGKDSRSSGRQSDRTTEASLFSRFSRAKEKASERDYSEVPGEKVKAKANLLLPDTDAELHENPTNDLNNRTSDRWERFDFDKDAPLDDDAKLDYFGDGTGTADDTLFLKNTGSSFLSSHSQVKREALVTATHEAAIFGPREGLTLKTLEPEREAGGGKNVKDGGEYPHYLRNSEERDPNIATPSMNSVLSEQVVAMQRGGSWQDRALKMRKAKHN